MKFWAISIWHRTVRRIGAMGLATICLGIGAFLAVAWIPHLLHRADTLQTAITEQTAAISTLGKSQSTSPVFGNQQLDDYVAAFPALTQNHEDLKAVFLSANHQNVQLTNGEYQTNSEANAPLIRFTATFPISANYASTKKFAEEVLQKLPHAAMDELRMTRSATDSSVLESSIRFTFHYRRP